MGTRFGLRGLGAFLGRLRVGDEEAADLALGVGVFLGGIALVSAGADFLATTIFSSLFSSAAGFPSGVGLASCDFGSSLLTALGSIASVGGCSVGMSANSSIPNCFSQNRTS